MTYDEDLLREMDQLTQDNEIEQDLATLTVSEKPIKQKVVSSQLPTNKIQKNEEDEWKELEASMS